ncbi:MAG: Ig-like domain-containing protein [Prevotella sp.]|nr:Ig-like domain-containing protein [Prevotella sp.]
MASKAKTHGNQRTTGITHSPVGLILLLIAGCFAFVSCAKMGQPDGGWYDEDPPKILGSTPADKATGVKGNKISIYFDEFIKLDNPTEKIVVSPPQLEQPEIRGQGKRITVELKDTLRQNTTYTIDFSDAISDNNEGNPLGNYTYTFSTGDHIDTMEVAGYVLEAENLEPIKGILVGLYRADDSETAAQTSGDSLASADTLFQKTPMLRVSRTDSRGRFVVKGVANGRYRIYALQDVDGNYMFNQKSEKLAFTHDIIVPSSKPDIRQDTIWRDSLRIADIKRVSYTHFLPDDIVLRAFTEVQTDRYFLKSERQQADRFTLFYSYGNAELPRIKGLNFNEQGAFVVEPSVNQDTITYWLRDTTLVNQDTLKLEVSYLATDSTGILGQQTDTLEVLSRQPYAKRLKKQQEEYEKWKKQQERNEKRGRPFLTEMPAEALEPEYGVPTSIDPDQNISVKMPTPLALIDTAAIHLYTKIDTLWYRSKFLFGEQPGHPRTYQLIGEWTPGAEYSLEIDSAAFQDIYGKASKPIKKGFKVRQTEEFSTLFLTLSGMNGRPTVVQLLGSGERIVKETTTNTGEATFFYVKPGTYYVRMFVDENGNGIWDTGEYSADRQPEPVYYYPQEIECRAKWDVRQSWNPTERPLSQQKPAAITKQKGDQQRKQMNRNIERARKMGIEYVPR